MSPYIIEPYNPYVKKIKKKTLIEQIEEDEFIHNILREQHKIQLMQTPQMVNASPVIPNVPTFVPNTVNAPSVGGAPFIPIIDLTVHIISQFTSRVSSLSPTTRGIDNSPYYNDFRNEQIYSTLDNPLNLATRNTSFWAKDIDFSSRATHIVGFGSPGGACVGVLVTPDIVIQAHHYDPIPLVDSPLIFVDANNNQYARYCATPLDTVQIGTTDIQVLKLSEPLPPAIRPAKILPKSAYYGNRVNLKSNIISGGIIPTVVTNQFNQAGIHAVSSMGASNSMIQSAMPLLQPWYFDIINQDSGSPYFTIVNGELIVLGTFFDGFGGSGPNISWYKDEINIAITALGSQTKLTEVDLSGFITYKQ